ncbi:hypothetical protein QJN61_25040, partial [Escherichia coli]|uniref:hypothetical protein n=1 Tax=Escherichia coli TaxID=562 RepID=UPI003005C3CF
KESNKESNEEIMKNQPKDVIEEKLNNELKLRFRMMQTILKSEDLVYLNAVGQ